MNKIKLTEHYYMLNESKTIKNGDCIKDTSTLYYENDKEGCTVCSDSFIWPGTNINECYRYYHSMMACMRRLIDKRRSEIKKDIRLTLGISRLTSRYQTLVDAYYANDIVLNEFIYLRNLIITGRVLND